VATVGCFVDMGKKTADMVDKVSRDKAGGSDVQYMKDIPGSLALYATSLGKNGCYVVAGAAPAAAPIF
jgi:hypothetical protein